MLKTTARPRWTRVRPVLTSINRANIHFPAVVSHLKEIDAAYTVVGKKADDTTNFVKVVQGFMTLKDRDCFSERNGTRSGTPSALLAVFAVLFISPIIVFSGLNVCHKKCQSSLLQPVSSPCSSIII